MMRKEARSLNLTCANDDKNLELLLEASGSKVSNEDLASAYCKADRNVSKAGEILCNMHGTSSGNPTSVSNNISVGPSASSVGPSNPLVENSFITKILTQPNERNRESSVNGSQQKVSRPKPRNRGVSVGTVSGVIGVEYSRARASSNEVREKTKPVKLMSSEIPESEIWEDKNQKRSETMNKHVEEFLLRMLGSGFQLGMDVIRAVVGGCGYYARESVEKLMNMSAPTLGLGEATSNVAAPTSTEKGPDLVTEHEEKLQFGDSTASFEARHMTNNEPEHPKRGRDGSSHEKEVLTNLFAVPERSEEGPRKFLPTREARTRIHGVVTGPLKDQVHEFTTPIVKREVNGDENKEDEDNYEAQREAVKEDWKTMKKYYITASEAYVNGNYEQADKLFEKGHFFMDRAREINENSARKLHQTRDDGETISIDVHESEPKEAVRLLKTHLKSMSGIPSICYLKVIVGTNDDNTKQKTCKRVLSKLLGRDSIAWTEEQDGQVMTIRVDVIKPERLSFNQK